MVLQPLLPRTITADYADGQGGSVATSELRVIKDLP
jgi:hypothetical protein